VDFGPAWQCPPSATPPACENNTRGQSKCPPSATPPAREDTGAYQTNHIPNSAGTLAGEVVITVSQHYPPPDVEESLVAPTRAA
jgi:hypothetical protein